MRELTGYQRQCDTIVGSGDYCTLVLGHIAPHDGGKLPTPIEQCYLCWVAPRYLLDDRAQRHAELHRMDVTQKRQAHLRAKHGRDPIVLPDVITERLGAPDAG